MLKGKEIVLRPLQILDLDFLEKIENNKENWQFGSERKEYSRKDLEHYIISAKTDIKLAKQYRFVIDLKGVAIGLIDLFDYTIKSAGIGIIIAKEYRNQGFAKEALKLLVDYGFFVLNISQLHASAAKDNLASVKLFSSCKFVFEREKEGLLYFVKLAKKK